MSEKSLTFTINAKRDESDQESPLLFESDGEHVTIKFVSGSTYAARISASELVKFAIVLKTFVEQLQ